MRTHSLRFKLALTYAGIALLTALILGGILLGVLGSYYSRSEEQYLRDSAEVLASASMPLGDASQLGGWVQAAALQTQTRVRVYDAEGEIVADSGPPDELPAGPMMMGDHMRGEGHGWPQMFGRRLFGGGGERSGRTLDLPITGGGGAYVQLSEGPASGRNALVSAAQAWLLAAVMAVVFAAAGGWLMAARISRPVVALTEVSDAMAEGDLAARAPITRRDEVGHLADSFNAMAERVETTVTSLRRFVADAAHEIGTPLTALQADLELAERAAGSDDERRLVERALVQTGRLGTLSQSLLQLSRLEAGASGASDAATDLAAAARAAADGVASRAEQAGVDLELTIEAGPLPVAAEPAEIEVVLANLLDNAVKFTPAGGRVTLSVRREGASGLLSVADTGVGIPPDEQAEVFARFHRARNVAAYPGNGLGLAIVKAAVERRGGSVAFASGGSGTEFRVTLPLARADRARADRQA